MKRGPTWRATAFPGGVTAVLSALGYQPSLEVCDCAEHMEHQFAGRRSCVDVFFKADQIDLLLFQRVDDREEFPERASEAIKTDDGERVAGTGIVEQRSEAWPVEDPSGDNILKHADCTFLPETFDLSGDILVHR